VHLVDAHLSVVYLDQYLAMHRDFFGKLANLALESSVKRLWSQFLKGECFHLQSRLSTSGPADSQRLKAIMVALLAMRLM
jgi:hypothetical protein